LNENGSFWVENTTQNTLNDERTGVVGLGYCTSGDGNCSVSFNSMIGYTDMKPNY